MGTSRGDFHKYPRTPHLFGSTGTSDDKHLGEQDSLRLLENESLIVEEKLDGTNVGIHFKQTGDLVLQCRGHEITAGMHPQYDLFKRWVSAKRPVLENMLEDRLIIYGEWMYAKHSIHYLSLSHYFFEFDIFDKVSKEFLDLDARLEILNGTGLETVPVIHRGSIEWNDLEKLVGASSFSAKFEHPDSGRIDSLMEGLYLRTEYDRSVETRAKWVRPEFTEKIKQSIHWRDQVMVPNQLAENVDIWS